VKVIALAPLPRATLPKLTVALFPTRMLPAQQCEFRRRRATHRAVHLDHKWILIGIIAVDAHRSLATPEVLVMRRMVKRSLWPAPSWRAGHPHLRIRAAERIICVRHRQQTVKFVTSRYGELWN